MFIANYSDLLTLSLLFLKIERSKLCYDKSRSMKEKQYDPQSRVLLRIIETKA